MKSDGTGCTICHIGHRRCSFARSLKMWRMALFICHNCGKHKNSVGHRWSSTTLILLYGYIESYQGCNRYLNGKTFWLWGWYNMARNTIVRNGWMSIGIRWNSPVTPVLLLSSVPVFHYEAIPSRSETLVGHDVDCARFVSEENVKDIKDIFQNYVWRNIKLTENNCQEFTKKTISWTFSN